MGKKETLTEKINLRWLAVAIFLIALIPIILVPIYISIPERIYGPIIAGYSLGGAAILIYIMLRPYLRRRKRMNNGSTLDDYELENLPSSGEIYHERITMKAFTLAFVIAAVIISITIYFVPDTNYFSYSMVVVLVILLCIGYLFRALDVRCDNKNLSFYFGPFGKDVPLHQIENIEVTNIRPLKDFMGWGHRIGPDGSIGYIAAGTKGVKLDLKNGKAYVLTVKHPKRLTKHVRNMKERYY